jgi:putative phosphoesterase
MRIGVVSDTHNHLPNVSRIVELLNTAGVDRVVHTGDITQAKTLEVFARLDASLVCVYGNNAVERVSLDAAARDFGIELHEPLLELAWAGRAIWVVHDPREYEALLPGAGARGEAPALILHGHDHRYRLEQHHGAQVFNPGECAGHMKGKNAIGIVDLDTLACEKILF